MENPKQVIFLFSKYSSYCKRLFEYTKNKESLLELLNFRSVCIDNELIRNRVISDKEYEIKSVPALIIKYTSNIEVFQGAMAFQYIENVYNNYELEIRAEKAKQQETQRLLEEKERIKKLEEESILNNNSKMRERTLEPVLKPSPNENISENVQKVKTSVKQTDSEKPASSNLALQMQREREEYDKSLNARLVVEPEQKMEQSSF